MSTNRYKPHICILPEDEADEQIAIGFQSALSTRQYQVMPKAGGWEYVMAVFAQDYQKSMDTYQQRYFVLIIDFDNHFPRRYEQVKESIPTPLWDRVFVLGVLSEPEKLKSAMRHATYSTIGEQLAEDCRENKTDIWAHPLLRHNVDEIKRMPVSMREIMF